MRRAPFLVLPSLAMLALGQPIAHASPANALSGEIGLTIKNQAFQPGKLTVIAGKPITIQVKNADTLPAEFESSDLGREKVIPGGTTIPVFIGPLTPGTYKFFNDFHPDSRGTLVVVPPTGAQASGK